MEHGSVPDEVDGKEAVLLHACDNPPCVRPTHLSVGTTEENVADRHSKGRTAHGEQMPQTKVNADQQKEICDLYALGTYTQQRIADMFGVSQGCVSRITLLRARAAKTKVA
jgi:HNH endonuclease